MFGSFFHYKNFTDLLSEDQARAIAKKADNIMEGDGMLFFGCVYADGTASDFSTEKKPTDTHVVIAIGAQAMAAFTPASASMKKDGLSDAEVKRAMEQRIAVLESLVKQKGEQND